MTPVPKEVHLADVFQEISVDGSETDCDSTRNKRLTPTVTITRQLQTLSIPIPKWSRVEPRGNMLPTVGEYCFIINGREGDDKGQLGQVSELKLAMIEVKYVGADNSFTYKLKKPSSLIMLENGLTLTQNRVGTVTVCRILNQPFD
jgi:hypothetical protein